LSSIINIAKSFIIMLRLSSKKMLLMDISLYRIIFEWIYIMASVVCSIYWNRIGRDRSLQSFYKRYYRMVLLINELYNYYIFLHDAVVPEDNRVSTIYIRLKAFIYNNLSIPIFFIVRNIDLGNNVEPIYPR